MEADIWSHDGGRDTGELVDERSHLDCSILIGLDSGMDGLSDLEVIL